MFKWKGVTPERHSYGSSTNCQKFTLGTRGNKSVGRPGAQLPGELEKDRKLQREIYDFFFYSSFEGKSTEHR